MGKRGLLCTKKENEGSVESKVTSESKVEEVSSAKIESTSGDEVARFITNTFYGVDHKFDETKLTEENSKQLGKRLQHVPPMSKTGWIQSSQKQ